MAKVVDKSNEIAPVVTVGLAVYNGEAFLPATIDSLLSQSFTDFELVISDNASTDRTEAICRSRAAADRRIRYFRNDVNTGSILNHRQVLELARGRYFRWASANDLCRSDLLQKCLEVLEPQSDVVVVFGLTALVDEDNNDIVGTDQHMHLMADRPGERFIQCLSRVGLINQFAGLVRIDAIRQARPIGDYIASDTVLLAELSLKGKFFEIQEPLFIRRMGRNATTQGKTLAELKRFYNPFKPNRIVLPLWRQQGELFRAILRSDIPIADKWMAAKFVSTCFYWSRSRLVAEICSVFQQLSKKPSFSRSPFGSEVNSSDESPKKEK